MERVVLCVRRGMARLASCRCVPVCVLVDHFSDKSQHTPHNIAHNDLPRLCRGEASTHLLYALHQFCCVSALELSNHAE